MNAMLAIVIAGFMIGTMVAIVYASFLLVPILIAIAIVAGIYNYLQYEPPKKKRRRRRR